MNERTSSSSTALGTALSRRFGASLAIGVIGAGGVGCADSSTSTPPDVTVNETAQPAATYAVTQSTPAGPAAHFPAYDEQTGNVLVSSPTTAKVNELILGSGPSRTFTAAAGAHTVVVDAPSRRGFVTNKGAASVSVLNLTDGTSTSFAVGANPHGLAIDAARRRIYVTSIDNDRLEVFDLHTLAQTATVPVGDGPWGVTVDAGHVAVTDTAGTTVHVLDAETLAVRELVEVGRGPWNARFAGGTMFVTLEGAGEVVAVRDARVVWRTAVGASPHGIAADQRRHVVFAAVTGANTVAVLDARTGQLLQSIAVPAGPAGLTLDEASGRVFVASQGAGVVSTIAPSKD